MATRTSHRKLATLRDKPDQTTVKRRKPAIL